MKELFKLNDKIIYDVDTTILYTSTFKFTDDAIYFINHKGNVITKERTTISYDISDDIFEL